MWSRPKARRPASQTAGAKDGRRNEEPIEDG
jgi:hypothetical protein